LGQRPQTPCAAGFGAQKLAPVMKSVTTPPRSRRKPSSPTCGTDRRPNAPASTMRTEERRMRASAAARVPSTRSTLNVSLATGVAPTLRDSRPTPDREMSRPRVCPNQFPAKTARPDGLVLVAERGASTPATVPAARRATAAATSRRRRRIRCFASAISGSSESEGLRTAVVIVSLSLAPLFFVNCPVCGRCGLSDQPHGDREGKGEKAEQAQLEEEVGHYVAGRREPLELGGDDEDSPHDGNQTDEEKRLDDDQQEQDPVEHGDAGVDAAGARRDRVRELVHRADEHEHRRSREQDRHRAVEERFEADQSAEQAAVERPWRLRRRRNLSRGHSAAYRDGPLTTNRPRVDRDCKGGCLSSS